MPNLLAEFQLALGERYRLERVLGRGGMATVFLAEDCRHGRRVAVKVLRPELASTVGAERFLNEITIAANLTHPNILSVHDSGEAAETLYYVMPHVQGGSLRMRLQQGSRLAVEEAVRLATDVTEALVYAHASGIMHRDIKPENILLQAGRALVADFGIARAIEGASGITAVGLVVGSPPYMSPEQALGDPVDSRADIYAIGTVLYEMLAGAPPFTGPTMQTVLAKTLSETRRRCKPSVRNSRLS
jgi:serine/threonine-protein kinase